MAINPKATITHVEILCRAIRNIEDEINVQTSIMGGIPECKAFLEAYVDERMAKLAALKTMYRIETGTDYE